MSHINNQTQDLNSIELVQDLDHEAAASVSGGNLDFSALFDGQGRRLNNVRGRNSSLGSFNNLASWYNVRGRTDWIAYTGTNFTGRSIRLRAGTVGNLRGIFNNNIASVRPA